MKVRAKMTNKMENQLKNKVREFNFLSEKAYEWVEFCKEFSKSCLYGTGGEFKITQYSFLHESAKACELTGLSNGDFAKKGNGDIFATRVETPKGVKNYIALSEYQIQQLAKKVLEMSDELLSYNTTKGLRIGSKSQFLI